MRRESVMIRAMVKVAPLVAGLALVVASSAGATSQCGLRGMVVRGPTSPVCVAEQPCSAPAANVTLVFKRAGQTAVRARTGSTGAYRVVLAPGVYTVAPASARAMDPTSVRVVSGHFRRVDFSIDTGIR